MPRYAVALVVEVDAPNGQAAEDIAEAMASRAIRERGDEDPAAVDLYYGSPARAIPDDAGHDSDAPEGARTYLYGVEAPTLYDLAPRPIVDECYGPDDLCYPRGRCDTCGAPCDDTSGDCTTNPAHATALEV